MSIPEELQEVVVEDSTSATATILECKWEGCNYTTSKQHKSRRGLSPQPPMVRLKNHIDNVHLRRGRKEAKAAEEKKSSESVQERKDSKGELEDAAINNDEVKE